MNNNSTKHGGFGLIEVVISMMILTIISMSVYNGYLIIIKQTKAGQVKQSAALEVKKIIEEIQATIPVSKTDTLTIGGITLTKQSTTGSAVFYTERYLKEDYSSSTAATTKYVEKITATPTTVKENTKEITLNTDKGVNSNADRIYISKIGVKNYISYWTYSLGTYTPSVYNSIEIPSSSENEIELYVYLKPAADVNEETVEIKDYKGKTLLPTTTDINKDIFKNFVINFSNYKESNGTLPSNADIEINMYNETKTIEKVCIEKQKDLNANVKVRNGGVNIYDNRSENIEQQEVGTLYDVKVEISDYMKYTNNEIKEDKDNLFTGYSKKNIG